MKMAESILIAKNLTKNYSLGKKLLEFILHPFKQPSVVRALDQVSFNIKSGEILGIVGPNGAGKTTLLRILADLLEPDSGHVELFGKSYRQGGHSIRQTIGYASSDERSFFWRLSGRQNLDFFSRLYGVPRHQAISRIERILAAFDLEHKAQELFRGYSAGTKKKFALMRALLHEPQVLLLDELTNSLDPQSAQVTKQIVRDYIAEGHNRIAVWSSHRLEEIREICDKVLVMDQGRSEYFGPVLDQNGNHCRSLDLSYANLGWMTSGALEAV